MAFPLPLIIAGGALLLLGGKKKRKKKAGASAETTPYDDLPPEEEYSESSPAPTPNGSMEKQWSGPFLDEMFQRGYAPNPKESPSTSYNKKQVRQFQSDYNVVTQLFAEFVNTPTSLPVLKADGITGPKTDSAMDSTKWIMLTMQEADASSGNPTLYNIPKPELWQAIVRMAS